MVATSPGPIAIPSPESKELSMRVAFLGLGQMGGHMCDHVIAGGHDVTVFDPYPPAVEPRAKAGAKVAATPAASSPTGPRP